MRLLIIFLLFWAYTANADYIPEDSSRTGITIDFNFNSSMPLSKYLDTYSAKSGMALGYMLNDIIMLKIGYEGLLNKNIRAKIAIGEGDENAVFNNSLYYLNLAYKYNFDMRWAVVIGLKVGYASYWYELPVKDDQGDDINLDLGSEKIMAYIPEISLFYRVREWLDASFSVGYPIQEKFEYSYLDYFTINEQETSSLFWGMSLHFGFY